MIRGKHNDWVSTGTCLHRKTILIRNLGGIARIICGTCMRYIELPACWFLPDEAVIPLPNNSNLDANPTLV